ncbi:MAG TPA: hypothetical protein VFO06_08885 [Gemmatimonadales bacterium]|nr:hypothetical protein [Gemmatimonadales bacterium]
MIEVRGDLDLPVEGIQVVWGLSGSDGKFEVLTPRTDANGRSAAVWKLGLAEGTQEAFVNVGDGVAIGTGESVRFVAEASTLHVREVSVGQGHACAITMDRRAVCWGANWTGQLGTGDLEPRDAPTPVLGLPEVVEIRATGNWHTCARDTQNGVWCWGSSANGAVGPGAMQPHQLVPVRVPDVDGAVRLTVGSSWDTFSCALLASGETKCWGSNRGGMLGTGDTVSSAAPRLVLGDHQFTTISSGEYRTCGRTATGEAYCWGDARGEELAPLPAGMYLEPVLVADGMKFDSLAVGAYAVCGLRSFGKAYCFGNIGGGNLGTWLPNGEYATKAPVPPETTESFVQLESDGWSGMYARTSDGRVFMWGEVCCDAYVVPPVLITPTIHFVEIAAGSGNRYCGITESGGLYCGAPGWWFWKQEETLEGIPANPDSE